MPEKDILKNRQEAIKELISRFKIADQQQLVQMLSDEYGIKSNQAAVSRDLRKLGVIKKGNAYELPEQDVQAEILKLAIVNIDHNESLIVITTQPGLADFVGDSVDQFTDLEILGSLAGENVVFVTPKSCKKIAEVYQLLCLKLHFKK